MIVPAWAQRATTSTLAKRFRQLVNDFRSRYVLSYTPRGVDAAGSHPLEVTLKDKRYHVTARRGYQRQGAGS